MYDITIEGDNGNYQIPTGKGTLGNEQLGVSRSAERSVATGDFFEIGDLQFDPVTMQLDLRIISADGLDAAITAYDDLMQKASAATLIRFGPYERVVFGLTKPIAVQRLLTGYRVSLTFAVKALRWTVTASGEETWL